MIFTPFPKIPRWSKAQHFIVTEKIDGTNAQICINEECTEFQCGSRNRWITPDDDNYGFAGWAHRNKEALLQLGKGQHFGEWYGNGIQRGYGRTDKRFILFNTLRWGTDEQQERLKEIGIVDVVPVLHTGALDDEKIAEIMDSLILGGSRVMPFMNPEGIIIYQPATRSLYKKTFEDEHKGTVDG